MSEYQYYEFLAIDRPLTAEEMRELRSFSTRARITPSGFVNTYNWGDLKGDPAKWMEKYFDAHLYTANWGTRIFMARLPSSVLDLETARTYCSGESALAWAGGDHTILSFEYRDEEGLYFEEVGDEEGLLASLALVRAELARGDHRALYLGWLLCAQNEELEYGEEEPPVPPGLGSLNAGLQAFVDFLHVDPHLVHVAAEASRPPVEAVPSREELLRWLEGVPEAEKNGWLLRLIEGSATHLAGELLRRFHGRTGPAVGRREAAPPRTVGLLLAAAEARAEEQRRLEAVRAEQERLRREREAELARGRYLDSLAGKEESLWRKADELVAMRQPARYDEAVRLLADLRDLAARRNGEAEFRSRLLALRGRHEKKESFQKRLLKAGLLSR